MVYNLVREVTGETFIRKQGIGVESGTGLDVLSDLRLNRFLSTVGNNRRANLSAALKDSHNCGLILVPVPVIRSARLPLCILRALPPMKVSSVSHSPDKRF